MENIIYYVTFIIGISFLGIYTYSLIPYRNGRKKEKATLSLVIGFLLLVIASSYQLVIQ